MPHEVGKERDVVEFLQKVLGEPMPEGVRINDHRIQLVLDGELLQLRRNASRRDTLTASIDEDEARFLSTRFKPGQRFSLELLRDIDAAHLAPL